MTITINARPIGPGAPCYIIAEMSANHQQNFDKAVELLRVAADAGVDAVKLQTYTADTLTIDCDRDCFRIKGDTLWDGRTLYDLYQEASGPWDWQPRLMQIATELGVHLFSTPFDTTAADFLEEMGVPAFKIASFEIVDLPLIRYVAAKGKPMIISTGLASLGEIQRAVDTVRATGNDQIVLLKCTSAYPALPETMHLRTIPHLAATFGVPAGLSDHTMGTAVPVAAVALGACVIEKHYCMSRDEGGPDSAFSLEPHELRQLVRDVRIAEQALGRIEYTADPSSSSSSVFRRSLFIVEDVQAGQPLTAQNVRSIRPGNGLPPRHYDRVLGRTARTDLARGTPLAWDLID